MSNDKKIELRLSSDLAKAAKLRAAQSDQTIHNWILDLITQELQRPQAEGHNLLELHPIDLGRIDSRIDNRIEQRMAALEDRIAALTAQLPQESLLNLPAERHSRAA